MENEEQKIYSYEIIGVPPLQMVLVQAENDRQNRLARTILESPESLAKHKKERAVVRLIEHIHKTLA